MTVKDAKEKWCPMVQIAVTQMGDIVTNRLDQFNNMDCKADVGMDQQVKWASRKTGKAIAD